MSAAAWGSPRALGQGGVRRDEGVLGVGVAGLNTTVETLGELRVTDRRGGAHHRGEVGDVVQVLASAGGRLDVCEQGGRAVVLSEPGASEGG